jgi:hypothetical protein
LEHTAWRGLAFHGMLQPCEAYDDIPDYPANKDDDEDFHPPEQDIIGKQEAQDATAPGVGHLPLE